MSNTFFDAKISFAPSVNADDSEIETITMWQALTSDAWRKQVEALRAETDPAKRKAIKSKLPCITPGGTFSHISGAGITEPSGYLCADLDYKPEKEINADLEGFNLKEAVARLPYVAYCGKSCGGKGYFLIIRIADASKYKAYYRALQADFDKGGLTLDNTCSNIAFKRFVSWDDNPYINTAALPYSYTLPEREHTTRETLGRELNEEETRAKVEDVIKYCEDERVDITADYGEWMRILAALAGTFGAEGEDYAQRISSIYPDYNQEQTAAKYKSFLKDRGSQEQRVNIGTFFYIARQEIGKHDFDNVVV